MNEWMNEYGRICFIYIVCLFIITAIQMFVMYLYLPIYE